MIQALYAGWQARYLFFYSHRPRVEGLVDRACLSQWWLAPFVVDGVRYTSAEQWMMAEKARLFGDDGIRQQILQAEQPRRAKALGRQVSGFIEQVWQQHRAAIVLRGNWAKFRQNSALAHFLRNTAPQVLVEASPHDAVWGIGRAEGDPEARCPEKWPGLNLLGFALMEVRDRLEEES